MSRRARHRPEPWLALIAAALAGCGVVVGSAVDKANDFLLDPVRHWVFFDAYRHANDWGGGWQTLPSTHDMGDMTLGIAISGGGSRAAYFATCVLEELGRVTIPGTRRTYLDEVDYISAVSGGSLAGAYFCANRHREGFPADHDAFFAKMRADMRKNYEIRSAERFLLGSFLLLELTYYGRSDMFAEIWDSLFLDGLTFGDLDPAGPVLIVNATSYDSGQKFVFSRAPLATREFPKLTQILGERRVTSWTGESRLGATISFETIDSNIARCPLSTAVAASSSVPGILGPVVLRDRVTRRDVHLGDGGIYDNHGYESLVEAMLPEVQAHPERPAVVLVIDAAGFFGSDGSAETPTTSSEFLDRVTAIAWLRMAGYEELALHFAQKEALRLGSDYPFRRVVTETVSLYDTTGLPQRAIERDVRKVATRFSLEDESADAIREVAPGLTRAALERLARDLEARKKLLR
jgi:predicted acylesterase/phospholipase RssA